MSTIEASLRLEISDYQTSLAKAKGEAGKLRADLEKQSAGIERAILGKTERYTKIIDHAKDEIRSLRKEVAEKQQLKIDVSGYQAELKKAQASTVRLKEQMAQSMVMAKEQEARYRGAMGSTGGLGLGGAAATGVSALYAGKQGLDLVFKYDRMHRMMLDLEGSTAKAQKRLDELQETARLPGVGFEQAVTGDVRLRKVGISAEMSRRAIEEFGNELANSGGTGEQLDGIVLALTQMSGKSNIFAEEVNQIAERAPGIRMIMKEAFGTANPEEIQKMGLTFDVFLAKIVDVMSKSKRATAGLEESLADANVELSKMVYTIAKPIAEEAIPAFSKLVDITKEYRTELKLLGEVAGVATKLLGYGMVGLAPHAVLKGRGMGLAELAKQKNAEAASGFIAGAKGPARIASPGPAAAQGFNVKQAEEMRKEYVEIYREQEQLARMQRDDLMSTLPLNNQILEVQKEMVELRRAQEAGPLQEVEKLKLQQEMVALVAQERGLRIQLRQAAADTKEDFKKLREEAEKKQKEDADAAKQRQQMLADYKAEMAIIDARVRGEEEKANLMQMNLDILKEARRLQEELKLSEKESVDLAQKKLNLVQRLKETEQLAKDSAKDSRYDENGRRRTDGRKKVDAHIYSQDGPGGKPLSGLDEFYQNQQTPLRDTFKFPGLDAYQKMQETPLRDTFKFPGLDAYDELQKRPTGDQAQRNAAAETARPQGDASVAAAVQVVVQNLPAILQALQ